MSRVTLHCPECGELAPPTIVQPPPRIHQCIHCGARTPHAELKSTQHWAQGHGLRGAQVTRLMQVLFAVTDGASGNEHQDDPLPGSGVLSYDITNTAAGTHDAYGRAPSAITDFTADLGTLAASALKSSGTLYIPYDFQPCSPGYTIDFVRYYIRARFSGNNSAISAVQMDNRGVGSLSPWPQTGVPSVFTDGYVDLPDFFDATDTTQGPSGSHYLWTANLVNTAGWFIEMPFSITNGPASKLLSVSEFHLEIWGHDG